MQAKPSVGKRKNITDDSSQFDEEDIGSKGSGAFDSGDRFVGNVPNAFGR